MHRFLLFFLFLYSAAADAQDRPTPDALRQFSESFFADALLEHGVPGAALVVISDSGIVYMGGFGHADNAGVIAVDPVETQFQIASVTKLFTSTLVMQQVAAGRLSLDTDVNEYLSGWQIPAAFEAPVTLRHLLTHTAGFDEVNMGYTARTASDTQPLDEYLASSLPNRGTAPGDVISYSNHGMALAGLIAASVSGRSYQVALSEDLLDPVGLRSTGFDPPVHARRTPLSGYTGQADDLRAAPFLHRNAPPAGALTSTVADMGRFLRVFLSTMPPAFDREEMMARQAGESVDLPGHALGWMTDQWRGQRVLHHPGGIPGYSSLAAILPDAGLGFFLVANRSGFGLLRQFVDAFGDRFFESDPRATLGGCVDDCAKLAAYSGSYRSTRRARSGPENIWGVFKGSLTVWETERGLLLSTGREYAAVSPLLFSEIGGDGHLAFRLNDGGRPTHMFFGEDLGFRVPVSYERVPFFAGGSFVNEFFLSWLPMIMLTSVWWPIAWVIRRVRRRSALPGTAVRMAGFLFGFSALYYGFGFIQPGVAAFWSGGGEIIFGMPTQLMRLSYLPLLQAALLLPIVIGAVASVRSGWWGLASRIHFLVFALGSVSWVFFLVYFGQVPGS